MLKTGCLWIIGIGVVVVILAAIGSAMPKSAEQAASPTAAATPRPTPTLPQPTLTAEQTKEADRAAFLDYGKKLWQIGLASDKSNTALSQAMSQVATIGMVNLSRLAKQNSDNHAELRRNALAVTVPERGRKAKDALTNMATQRKDISDALIKAIDSNKPSDLADTQDQMRQAQGATLLFATEMTAIGTELGVDVQAELAE